MKRKIVATFILMVFSICTFSVGAITSYAGASQALIEEVFVAQIANHITTEETWEVTDEFEVYGNTAITYNEFLDIVDMGSPKVYLHYRTNRRINLPYDALLIVKTATKTISYEFEEKINTNANDIRDGIRDFVIKYGSVLMQNASNNAPVAASYSSVPTTFIDCVVEKEYVRRFGELGYIVYHIAVAQYVVNSTSILYIVTINNSFTPGFVATQNGETGYDNYKIKGGYVHMTVEQAYDANEEYFYGKRWGNVPYKKDFWPINSPAVCTINSSLQAGVNLGYSFENGFSLDNISISENRNIGRNISFGYSKSITRPEPALSVQLNSENTSECEWSFYYEEKAAETYHLQSNYMFEISNSRNEMFIGDFRLKLDYKLIVRRAGPFWDIQESTYSDDLMVRAGEYQRIYAFCNGMI